MTPILQDHQILSRNSGVVSTEVGGDLALMSISNGCYYALNSVASAIWRKLEETIRVDQRLRRFFFITSTRAARIANGSLTNVRV